MQIDSYLSKCGNRWKILCVPTGKKLSAGLLSAVPAFRLIRRNLTLISGEDRFLMDTEKVVEDIKVHGVAWYTLEIDFSLEEAGVSNS